MKTQVEKYNCRCRLLPDSHADFKSDEKALAG